MAGLRKSSLKRSMRVMGALLLTLSVVTPASSVYVIIPGIITQAGTGALISLAASACVGLAMAFVYAELASAFPIAGAEYSMVGRAIGPWSGFVMLGVNAVNMPMGMAALAVGASTYLESLAPGLSPQATGIALVVAATGLSLLNIRTNAWITGVFLAAEILALLVLIGLGFFHSQRSLVDIVSAPTMMVDGSLQPVSLTAIGLGITIAAFAYNGFGSAVSFAEEMHDAPRLVARTILWALVVTVFLEIMPVIAVFIGAPDLEKILGAQNPFNEFVLATGGSLLDQILGFSIALAIANAVLATILVNARFLFATGRDQVWWPQANEALVRISSHTHAPWVATLISGLTTAAACLVPLPTLLVFSGTGIVLVYGFLAIGVLTGRQSGTTAHAPYQMPAHPGVAIFALLAIVYVAIANLQDPEFGRPGLIFVAAVVAVSTLFYWAVIKPRGTWVLQGPDPD
jgi:amino acid transporter